MTKHTLQPIALMLLAVLVALPLAWVSESHPGQSPRERSGGRTDAAN